MRTFLTTFIIVLLMGFLLQAPFDRLKQHTDAGELQANSITAKQSRAGELFHAVLVQAKAVIVQEYPSEEVLFAKDERTPYPLASVAKLMTAFALQDVEQHKTSPFPLIVPVTEAAVREEGDNGFLIGEEFYFEDLVDTMLVQSSNDAAHALGAFAGGIFYKEVSGEQESLNAFVQYMNIKKDQRGLSDLSFFNVTGLDIDEENNKAGAYGSAASVAKLLRILMSDYPFLLEKTKRDELIVSSSVKSHTFKNSNALAVSLPGLRASKTGYTDLAGGNLAIVADIGLGRTVVIVVLGSTFDGRFSDVAGLYNAALEYYRE